MWFICAVLTFLFWGVADLFYKKGNDANNKYSHLVTGMMVGFVMGIHATLYLIITKTDVTLIELLKYLSVSLCYIVSMVIGYKGLKYLELSISSPIQNSSGIITSILLCLIFKIALSKIEVLGIIIVFIGVMILSILEIREDKLNKQEVLKKLKIQVIFFPIIYCIIDGLGTFFDSIYLDQMEILSEDAALLAYEYTFLIYGVIILIYLKIFKREKFSLKKEKIKLGAAIFETLGQFTYVFAIASHSVITIPIISCYSALSVLLSRVFLKEKLSLWKYISIMIIFIGILILGFVEGN